MKKFWKEWGVTTEEAMGILAAFSIVALFPMIGAIIGALI